MWILLIIACIAIPYICIRFLATKLQSFIDSGGFSEENLETSPTAIVMGKTVLSKEVCDLLEKNEMRVTAIRNPYLMEKKQSCQFLFALSDSDVDNLLMCRIDERVYNIKNMISICNDRENEKMYQTGNIPYCSSEEFTAQLLVEAILKKKDVIICQKN